MRTNFGWFKIFDSKDACVTPVLQLDEIEKHPHNASRNSFIKKNNCVVPRPAPKLSVTPGVSCATKPVATCGQHTSEILKGIGYSQNEIDTLLKNKTIFEDLKSNL